mmetsp:Transcript_68663/g.128099  ORF Transcript_68663/g.128099 Transcript_68663/m.128099 type:complete len:162 (-) Transcript_68663:10-495(-)
MAHLFSIALLAAATEVYGRRCHKGRTVTYPGACSSFGGGVDIESWEQEVCMEGIWYCYSESYTVHLAADCEEVITTGGCAETYHDDYCSFVHDAWDLAFDGIGSGYRCEQCRTDYCNPMDEVTIATSTSTDTNDHRASGSVRANVEAAGVLVIVAAMLASF